MLKRLCALGILTTWLFAVKAQEGGTLKITDSKSGVSDFEGVWRGTEKCKNISSPGIDITITANGPAEVVITGLYSTTGNVTGAIKNNTITVLRQKIPDPIFQNIRIEGNLEIAKDHKSLTGIILIWNNDAKDDCSVTYSR